MKFCFDTVCVVVVFEKFLIPCTIITIFMTIPFLKLNNDCTFLSVLMMALFFWQVVSAVDQVAEDSVASSPFRNHRPPQPLHRDQGFVPGVPLPRSVVQHQSLLCSKQILLHHHDISVWEDFLHVILLM